MWKRKYLTADEIEHEANTAAMELALANSGSENSDSDDYHNSDFKDDDSLFSRNEDDVSESSDFEEGVVRKKIRQGSSAATIEEPSTSRTSVSQHAECVGIQETTNKTRGRGRPSKLQKTSTEGANDTFTTGTTFFGNDKYTSWKVINCGGKASGRTQIHNVFKETPGPTPYAKRHIMDEHIMSSWRLLISDPMLKHIKFCTEAEAQRRGEENRAIPLEELEAFIALLYVRGSYKCGGMDYDLLWSKDWVVMSRNRFRNIMRYLRFDEKITRSERLKSDKFALISSIWNIFIENCILCYKPSEFVTVDEQLFPTKARCQFTQYMANKPDKFGIKFWMLGDAKSKYMCNALPYLGKDDHRPANESLTENVVWRLIEPFLNKGRNVTTDNFFTSVKLAKRLKPANTTIVGTMNKKRREIPVEAKNRRAQLYDTKVLQHEDCTLTVYQGKKEKNVIILSTMHSDIDIGSTDKKVPETVHFHNNTKYGVDVIDQMARQYTTRAGSRRCPVQVFYNIIDLALINAWILYKETTGRKLSRHMFLQKLAEELRRAYCQKKRPIESGEEQSTNVSKVRHKCQILKKCKGNKTVDKCKVCLKFTCGKCTQETIKFVTCANH